MSDETRTRVREAIEDACLIHLGRGIGTIHADDIAQAAIDAYEFCAVCPPADHAGFSSTFPDTETPA